MDYKELVFKQYNSSKLKSEAAEVLEIGIITSRPIRG